MKKQWMIMVLAGIFGILASSPLPAVAQSAGSDWDSLRAAVTGQKVEIRADGQGLVRGKVTEVTDERIKLQSGKTSLSIPRAEVRQVAVKQKSKRVRNALLIGAIGAGIAAAVGLGIVAGTGGSDDVAGVIALPIALGGVAGAGIGAAVPGGYRVVYQR